MPSSEPLDLSSLERASFRIVRRGFDTSSVRGLLTRAAVEIAELRRERDELRDRLAETEDAMAGSGPGLLEAHRVASALGVEASQVIEAAHVAATERADRAEREAAAVHDEASQAADLMRLAATEEADSLRAEGADQRDRLVAEAEAEAESIVDEARRRGREMVSEAQTVRERMLRDLGRKRHSGRTQVEQLRAGRDRLLESLSAVQEGLDSAISDLVASVPEARKAAEWAGLRISEQAEATPMELEAEIEAARLVDHPLADPGAAPYDREADEDADLDDQAGLSGADAGDAGRIDDLEAALGADFADADAGTDDDAAHDCTQESAPGPADDPRAPDATDSSEAGASGSAGAEATSATDSGDEIFAMLRSAEAREAADSTQEPGTEPDDAEPDDDAPAPAPQDVIDAAARAAKKVLVDEQSTLLHRIRSQGEQALSELLDSADRRAAYRDVLMPLLSESVAAAGAEPPDLTEACERFDEFALAPVDQRLRELLESEPDPDELAAAVRSLYRESRSRRIADAAAAAFETAHDQAVSAVAEGR